MANMRTGQFRLYCNDGINYTVYYKNNGSCFCYGVHEGRHGAMIMGPTMRVSNVSYNTALAEYNRRCES